MLAGTVSAVARVMDLANLFIILWFIKIIGQNVCQSPGTKEIVITVPEHSSYIRSGDSGRQNCISVLLAPNDICLNNAVQGQIVNNTKKPVTHGEEPQSYIYPQS